MNLNREVGNVESELVKVAKAPDQPEHRIDVPDNAAAPEHAAPQNEAPDAQDVANQPAAADPGSDASESKSTNYWLWVGLSVVVLTVGFFCLAAWKPDTFSPRCSRNFFRAKSPPPAPTPPSLLWQEWGGKHGGSNREDVPPKCVNHQNNRVRIQFSENPNGNPNYLSQVFEVPRISNTRENLHLTSRTVNLAKDWGRHREFYRELGMRRFKGGYTMTRIGGAANQLHPKFKFLFPFEKLNGKSREVLKLVLDLYFQDMGISPKLCECASCRAQVAADRQQSAL